MKVLSTLLIVLAIFQVSYSFQNAKEKSPFARDPDYILKQDLKFLAKKHDIPIELITDVGAKEDKKEEYSLTNAILKARLKNVCLVNKDGSRVQRAFWLTEQQKLEAFIRGPCSPALLMSGISGSGLQVEIDCEVLQRENPDIFKSCGWTTCSKFSLPFVDAMPKKEYRLWIAGTKDPMSLFNVGEHNKERSRCFGNLIQQVPNPNSTRPEDKYKSPDGLRVTIVGDTPQTKQGRQCGNSANRDLLNGDKHKDFLACALYVQREMQEVTQAMGYQPGITQQYIPYDWRRSVAEARTDIRIKNSLKRLKKYTGKKSVFMTHSYSGLHALYALNKYDQQFKDDHIDQWVPTGIPFSGTAELLKAQINADDQFFDDLFNFFGKYITVGVQVYSQRQSAKIQNSSFDMFPKNTQEVQKDEPWMKEFLKRIEYEKKTVEQGLEWDEDEIPFPEFPKSTDKCRPEFIDKPECRTFFYDELAEPILTIDGNKYYLTEKDMVEMMKKYVSYPNSLEMMKENWQKAFVELSNPGVKVTNVYGSFGDVAKAYEYKQNPIPFTEKYEMYKPEVSHQAYGDLTVTTNSSLKGPMKWLYENTHANGDETKKPVKIVEFCSIHNQTSDINDEVNENGEKTYTKSGYHGLKCSCLKDGKMDKCTHACIVGDPYYIEFLTNMMQANQISEYMKGGIEKIPQFENDGLKKDVEECSHMFPNTDIPEEQEY